MARRAARQHLAVPDLIILSKLGAFVGAQVVVLPLHVIDLGLGPDPALRIAVAGDTPLHLQSVFLINGRHFVDAAVAGRTADAFRNVDTVIEINELGKVVHTFPFDRLILAEASPDRLKVRTVTPKLAVTVHARLGWRHTGRRRGLDRRVAVSAIYAIVSHVVLVAELDGLLLFKISAGEI